jgi:hypothetical protein
VLDEEKTYSFQKDRFKNGHKEVDFPLKAKLGDNKVASIKKHVFDKYQFQEPVGDIAT